MVVIKVIYSFCRFQDGLWSGDPRLTVPLNEYHQAHADSLHPDPDLQAIRLARKVFWDLEVNHRDRPGKPYKDPDDQAPHWLQCLFDPDTTLQPISRLFWNVKTPKKNDGG